LATWAALNDPTRRQLQLSNSDLFQRLAAQ
jgi:hypothetical protein